MIISRECNKCNHKNRCNNGTKTDCGKQETIDYMVSSVTKVIDGHLELDLNLNK